MRFKKQIADLPSILKRNKVRHIIICPGSRNAPLIQLFFRDKDFSCHSIVDERSAGYIALGMSKQLGEPVVVLTTSGTAVLNLGPAVAEAYYQKIPLIVLTADRPPEWPGQFSNQIVNQDGIFLSNSKSSYNMTEDIEDEDSFKKMISEMSDTIYAANSGIKGPVHVNIQFTEPLYEALSEEFTVSPRHRQSTEDTRQTMTDSDSGQLTNTLTVQKRVLVFLGAGIYTAEEAATLQALTEKFNVVLVAENIANLHSGHLISQPELVLGSLGRNWEALKPDLILSIGGRIVSKLSRMFVQGFKGLSVMEFVTLPTHFLNELILAQDSSRVNEYLAAWKSIKEGAKQKAENYLKNAPFCNLTAMSCILERIPDNAVVHLGNSGSIRYSQLCTTRVNIDYHANRGTSGIDGSLSTAVGAAMVSDLLHVVILGDLSFVYDSNALWNKDFPNNLQIIVLNDRGGGIFKIIEGPDTMPFFEEFSVTKHPVQLKGLAMAYGLDHMYAFDIKTLNEMLNDAFKIDSGPGVLEVDTSSSENSSIFKGLYKSIQEQ